MEQKFYKFVYCHNKNWRNINFISNYSTYKSKNRLDTSYLNNISFIRDINIRHWNIHVLTYFKSVNKESKSLKFGRDWNKVAEEFIQVFKS